MNFRQFLNHVVVRNVFGVLALLAVHYVSDQYHMVLRSGFNQFSPYIFLLLLYGWLVFHNRILFERLYLRNRKQAYVGWLLLGLTISSLNMHFILRLGFGVIHTLPQIVSFWVYTLTGLGVYVTYRYLRAPHHESPSPAIPKPLLKEPATFECSVNGEKQVLLCADILYIESLENYVKVYTASKAYITRLALKEAEERLPKPPFVRISRSHIVNVALAETITQETVTIKGKPFRIGRVYKRYVAEQLAG